MGVTRLADDYIQYHASPVEVDWYQQYGQSWKHMVLQGLASLQYKWYESARFHEGRLHAREEEVSQMETHLEEALLNADPQELEGLSSISNERSRLHKSIQLGMKNVKAKLAATCIDDCTSKCNEFQAGRSYDHCRQIVSIIGRECGACAR